MTAYRSHVLTDHGSPAAPRDLVVPAPAGLTDGDKVYVLIVSSAGTQGVDLVPSGWTTEVDIRLNLDYHWALYSKVASSEPASWTWSLTTSGIAVSVSVAFSDVSDDTGITFDEVNATNVAVGTTTTKDNAVLLMFAACDATASRSWTNSSGSAVERVNYCDPTEFLTVGMWTEDVPSATILSRTMTLNGSDQMNGVIVGLQPAGPGVGGVYNLFVGEDQVTDLKVGPTDVLRAYVGTTLVFGAAP